MNLEIYQTDLLKLKITKATMYYHFMWEAVMVVIVW